MRWFVVATCLVAASASLRLVAAVDLAPPATKLAALPLTMGGWRGVDNGRLDADTESVLRADAYVNRTYGRGTTPLSLFVAYYATQRAGRTIHSPLNCLPGSGWGWVSRDRVRIATDAGDIEVNRNVARKDGASALVYYWYQSRGRVVASDYRNKLALMHDAISLHRSDGALVRVVTPLTQGSSAAAADSESFIRAAHAALTSHLPE